MARQRCGPEEKIAPAFIAAGSGEELSVHLNQKGRRQEGRGAAAQFCPLLSLHEMKDAQSTSVCVCVCVCEFSSPPSVLCMK